MKDKADQRGSDDRKCPSDSVEAPNLRFNAEDEELPFSDAELQE